MPFENDNKLTRREFCKQIVASTAGLGFGAGTIQSIGCTDIEEVDENECTNGVYENSVMAGELYKVYPLTQRITESANSSEEAVLAVVQWCEKNFFHYYQNSNLGEDYGLSLYSPNSETNGFIRNISIEEVFRERAVGCHLATFVMITMLRSIGISAEYFREDEGKMAQSCNLGGLGGHGVLYVPFMDRYVHGDFVADFVGTPAAQIMQTEEELLSMSSAPRGYLSFEDQLFEKYWFGLHRNLERELYIYGCFDEDTPEQEIQAIMDNLTEYNIVLQPKVGNNCISSERLPIEELVY